jgi:hypothetical protein
MKMMYSIFILMLTVSAASALTIQSGPGGGDWSEPTTWIDEVVPTAVDDVIIDGPVLVDGSVSCNHLSINSIGSMFSDDSGTRSIEIFGNVENLGSVGDGYYGLNMTLHGDLDNEGSWENDQITFPGAVIQHLSMGALATFSTEIILDLAATEDLSVETHFVTNSLIDLNGGDMFLAAGGSLEFLSGQLSDGNLIGNGRSLTMSSSAYVGSMIIDNAVLEGIVRVAPGTSFTGGLIVNGTLQNRNTGNYSTSIEGALTNNGVITHDYYGFQVDLFGNLTNNSVISCTSITMSAEVDRHLVWDPLATFTAEFFVETDPLGDLIGDTDLRFSGDVDLNGAKLRMMPGNSLELDGPFFQDGVIEANGNVITCTDPHYFSNVTIEQAQIDGVVRVMNNVSFTGGLTNLGTFQNRNTGNYTTSISGGFINEGTVTHDYYALYIELSGNLVNNGDWINNTTTIVGDGDRSISMAGDATFLSDLILADTATGNIIATTPLRLGDLVDLEGGTLVLNPGSSLSVDTGPVQNGFIQANGNAIEFTGGCYIVSVEVDSADLHGIVRVQTGVSFTGGLTVTDTLQNRNTGNYTTSVSGDLVNNGLITRDYYNFYMNLDGDLITPGDISNSSLTMLGLIDQHISLGDTASVSCDMILDPAALGDLHADTPLRFAGEVDLNGGNLILNPGSSLEMESEQFVDGVIVGNKNKVISGPATYFQNTTFNTVSLHGLTRVMGNTNFQGSVTVEDTLQNRNTGNYSITVEGDLINRGVIRRDYYQLNIIALANVWNEGVWTNPSVIMDGSEDQYVGASDTWPIEVDDFDFDSNLATGPYQWFKDGLPLAGETGVKLSFPIINNLNYGRYHCESGAPREISRDFWIVEGSLSVDFSADVTTGGVPLTVNFSSLGEGATTWAWDFDGDGITDSSVENPSFEYGAAGLYTVTLTVSNDIVSDSEVKLDYIEVTEPTDATPPALVLGLEQNYPNPFNPKTNISFALSSSGQTRLSVYDSSGRRVAVLADEYMDAGTHRFTWNAEHQASGVFFYKLEAAGESFVKKCVLLK